MTYTHMPDGSIMVKLDQAGKFSGMIAFRTEGQINAANALRDKLKIEYAIKTTRKNLRTEFVR